MKKHSKAYVFTLIALGVLGFAYWKNTPMTAPKDKEQSTVLETPEPVTSATRQEQLKPGGVLDADRNVSEAQNSDQAHYDPRNQNAENANSVGETQAQPQKIYSVEEGLKKLEKDFPAANANIAVPFTEPPKERLVKDQNGAEMIEVTYQDGSKVYLPNLPRHNALEGTMTAPLNSKDDD